MRAADARDRTLVAQQRVELAPLAAEDAAERFRPEAERVRAEVSELRLERRGREQPDSGAPLLAGFGQHELAAVLEGEAEHGRLRRLRPGRVVPEPARAHQVHPEHELAVLGREEQVLPTPAGTSQPSAVEGRQGRIERLHGGDVGRAGACDGCPRDERVELAHPRLHFR